MCVVFLSSASATVALSFSRKSTDRKRAVVSKSGARRDNATTSQFGSPVRSSISERPITPSPPTITACRSDIPILHSCRSFASARRRSPDGGDDATVHGVVSSGDVFRHVRSEESDDSSNGWVTELLQRQFSNLLGEMIDSRFFVEVVFRCQ